jgi:hypothetical protein
MSLLGSDECVNMKHEREDEDRLLRGTTLARRMIALRKQRKCDRDAMDRLLRGG